MTTVGLLYPGHSAEDDYPRLEMLFDSDIRLPLVHTDIGEDAHRVDALLEMGSARRLADGVEELRMAGAESVVWACTSGSFVYGWDGAHEQARQLAVEADCPPPAPPSPSRTRSRRWARGRSRWRRPIRRTSRATSPPS